VTYERLGAIAAQTGQAAEAHALYTQALTIAQGLAETEPTNTTYQRDLSISYERLAVLADEEQEKAAATEWFMKALTIRRALNVQEPQRIDLA
jgi:Tfp pilus assembly protein PilF